MNQLTMKRVVYLLLALSGAVGTWYFNLQLVDLSQFFALAWETPVSSSTVSFPRSAWGCWLDAPRPTRHGTSKNSIPRREYVTDCLVI